MASVRMIRNPHLVYIDDSEDSEDEVFVAKDIEITPRKTSEKYDIFTKKIFFFNLWKIIWIGNNLITKNHPTAYKCILITTRYTKALE